MPSLADPSTGIWIRSGSVDPRRCRMTKPVSSIRVHRVQNFWIKTGSSSLSTTPTSVFSRRKLGYWLQSDQYLDSQQDQELSKSISDLNRQQYASGNPVGVIDIDGHSAFKWMSLMFMQRWDDSGVNPLFPIDLASQRTRLKWKYNGRRVKHVTCTRTVKMFTTDGWERDPNKDDFLLCGNATDYAWIWARASFRNTTVCPLVGGDSTYLKLETYFRGNKKGNLGLGFVHPHSKSGGCLGPIKYKSSGTPGIG